MAFAQRTVQNMPDCLQREPMMALQPASMTPEPANRWSPIRTICIKIDDLNRAGEVLIGNIPDPPRSGDSCLPSCRLGLPFPFSLRALPSRPVGYSGPGSVFQSLWVDPTERLCGFPLARVRPCLPQSPPPYH